VPTALVIFPSVVLILQYTHWQGFDIVAYADAATVFLDTMLALVFVLAACAYFRGAVPPSGVALRLIPAGGAAPASTAPRLPR
jgi:hypothetical protein